MILATKPPTWNRVTPVEGLERLVKGGSSETYTERRELWGKQVNYYDVYDLRRSIMEAAEKCGALHFENEGQRERFIKEALSNLFGYRRLEVRVEQAWAVEVRLAFALINPEKLVVVSPERPKDWKPTDEGLPYEDATLTTYDLQVSLSGPSTGYTLASARTMAKLYIDLCELGEVILAQFGGYKIGVLNDPNDLD